MVLGFNASDVMIFIIFLYCIGIKNVHDVLRLLSWIYPRNWKYWNDKYFRINIMYFNNRNELVHSGSQKKKIKVPVFKTQISLNWSTKNPYPNEEQVIAYALAINKDYDVATMVNVEPLTRKQYLHLTFSQAKYKKALAKKKKIDAVNPVDEAPKGKYSGKELQKK